MVKTCIPFWWRDKIRQMFFSQSDEISYPKPSKKDKKYILNKLNQNLQQIRKESRVDVSYWNLEE
jgi:hypothetical protein